MSSRIKNWLRYWWPAALWAVAISIFSTDLFSHKHTSAYIIPFLQRLMPQADADTILMIDLWIRKAVHFVEYFTLSALVFRGFRGPGRGWRLDWSFWTVAVAAAYASLDEVHQSFVRSRTGSAMDVVIDTSGALAAQLLIWLWYRKKSRRPGAEA